MATNLIPHISNYFSKPSTSITITPDSNNISNIPNLPHLETIITDPDSKLNISNFPDLPNLKFLEIGILDDPLPNLPDKLETLIIHRYERMQEPLDFTKFINLKHLQINKSYCYKLDVNLDLYPNLEKIQANERSSFNVTYSKSHPKIKVLHVNNYKFELKENYFPSLEQLSCERELIGNVHSYPNLIHLKFREYYGNKIDIGKLTKLICLDIIHVVKNIVIWPDVVENLQELNVCDSVNCVTIKKFPSLRLFRIAKTFGNILVSHGRLEELYVTGIFGSTNVTVKHGKELKVCMIENVNSVIFKGRFDKLEELTCNMGMKRMIEVNLDNMRNLRKLNMFGKFVMSGDSEKLEELTVDKFVQDIDLSRYESLKKVRILRMEVRGKVKFGSGVEEIKFDMGICDQFGCMEWEDVEKNMDISLCKGVEVVKCYE